MKKCSENIFTMHKRTSGIKSFFIKVPYLKPSLKKNVIAGVFLLFVAFALTQKALQLIFYLLLPRKRMTKIVLTSYETLKKVSVKIVPLVFV